MGRRRRPPRWLHVPATLAIACEGSPATPPAASPPLPPRRRKKPVVVRKVSLTRQRRATTHWTDAVDEDGRRLSRMRTTTAGSRHAAQRCPDRDRRRRHRRRCECQTKTRKGLRKRTRNCCHWSSTFCWRCCRDWCLPSRPEAPRLLARGTEGHRPAADVHRAKHVMVAPFTPQPSPPSSGQPYRPAHQEACLLLTPGEKQKRVRQLRAVVCVCCCVCEVITR